MTERNDPCPCLSGLKYKKCCLKKESLLKQLPCQTYHESYTLQDLLNNSPQFKSFYESERAKITGNINWAHDPDLGLNIRSSYLPVHKEYLVVFKTLPITSVDELATAHELQHFICTEEGYPTVTVSALQIKGDSSKLAAALSSSLTDPIVNKRLIPFGFDLWSQYDKESKIQKTYFEQAAEPQTPTEKLYFTSFYIVKALGWDVCCLTSPRDTNEFLVWFDSHFSGFSQEAKEIVTWIKEHGYETPEQLKSIFTDLIAKFELTKELTVSTYSVGKK